MNEMIRLTVRLKRSPHAFLRIQSKKKRKTKLSNPAENFSISVVVGIYHPGEWHKKTIISLVIPAAVKRLNPIRPPSWRRWGKSQSAGRGDGIKPRVNRDSGRFNRGVMRVVRSP